MKGVYGANVYNFSPTAFNLPNDYTKFVTEYTKEKDKEKQSGNKDLFWICKPADMSRGRGIFVFKELSDLNYDCNAVVQKYISHPYLIGGYKFDLRIYVAVPSFHPLRIYVYEEGLARFSTDKYDLGALGNLFSHLTNTSINKHSPMYAADKDQIGAGCKWTITQLRHFFWHSNIDDHSIWAKIINIIILTLIMQHGQVPKAENCFELYGFDVIIDENLKPWLLEVNFSPAMSCDCQTDILVKKPMLHDMMDILGFREKDKERGGEEHRTLMSKSRSVPNYQRHKKPLKSLKNKKVSNPKLPHITKSKVHSHSQGKSQGSASSQTSSERPESAFGEDTSDGNVVPVLPGHGLPSVQQNSNQSNNPLSKSQPFGTSTFMDWRSQSPTKYNTNYVKSLDKMHLGSDHTSYKGYKVRKRVSLEQKRYSVVKSKSSPLLQTKEQSSLSESSQYTTMSDGRQNHLLPAKSHTYPRHSIDGSRPVPNKSSLSHDDIASVSEKDDIENNNSRSLHPNSDYQDRKLSFPGASQSKISLQMGDNHSTSSNQEHRKSDSSRRVKRNSVLSSPKPRYLGNPYGLKKQNSFTSQTFSRSQTAKDKFVPRYGGFHLVFPFSDATRKCSSTANIDLRTIITECQKLLTEEIKGKEHFRLWAHPKSEASSLRTEPDV